VESIQGHSLVSASQPVTRASWWRRVGLLLGRRPHNTAPKVAPPTPAPRNDSPDSRKPKWHRLMVTDGPFHGLWWVYLIREGLRVFIRPLLFLVCFLFARCVQPLALAAVMQLLTGDEETCAASASGHLGSEVVKSPAARGADESRSRPRPCALEQSSKGREGGAR
jgi:hypothetical protein